MDFLYLSEKYILRYSGVYPRVYVIMAYTNSENDVLAAGQVHRFFVPKMLKHRIMTNKEALRDLVADLQLARMRFNETVEIYPERPIDHFIINFSEAVDSAVDAVFGIYNDVMLQEIDGDICGKGGKR